MGANRGWWKRGMERKSEWTSEGEQKRDTGVWETEKTLREQGQHMIVCVKWV